jgi:subtilisin family serine protease
MRPSPAPRELIVVAEPEVGLRVTTEGLISVKEMSLEPLNKLLRSESASLKPLFGLSEELIDRRSLATGAPAAPTLGLSLFYRVSAPDSRLEALAEQFRQNPTMYAAFIKPGAELPLMNSGRTEPPPTQPSEVTPDLSSMQIYLGSAPEGVNAIAAWNQPGGGGAGIRIIDVEGAWRFTHEDLTENQGGVVGGSETSELLWRNHGTAVLGIVSGDRNEGNNFGIMGICPEANVRAVSIYGQPDSHLADDTGTAAAIRQAADLLRRGDILLIEMQLPGPQFGFEVREDQQGYIPVEWWPDNLAAIQYAVGKGVIVVEAAGNGACDLNSDIFEQNPATPHGPFPVDWKNPFRRTNTDSGAIVVGAGAPRRGLNGSKWGPDRSRLDFSNFGCLLDAQGWGQEVTTCGFGNLQQGADEDRWYTPDFGGTSSATPMVVGVLACVQGVLLAADKPLLTPATARQLLRTTGSPQVDADPGDNRPTTQRIGNRPDILQMISKAGLLV